MKQQHDCAIVTALVALTAAAVLPAPTRAEDVALARSRFWLGGYSAPRLPMAADLDGDGLADFVGLYPPEGGILDFIRTSPLGKPLSNVQARRPFAGDAVAVVCGPLLGLKGSEVLAVLPDGTVHVACGLNAETHLFDRDEIAATLDPASLPPAPVRARAADFDGDGRPDVLLVGGDGRLLWLRNTPTDATVPQVTPMPVEGLLADAQQVAAGSLDGSGRADVVWLAHSGALQRARIAMDENGNARLADPVLISYEAPSARLAVGRFRGEARADILVGQRLLPGGDPEAAAPQDALPGEAEAAGDLEWIAADFTGDGLDDLLRVRRCTDRFREDDLLLHVSARRGETPAFQDADNDGLPDAWETGAVQPGGLDLPALGCSPLHADVIVEVQPIEGVPDDRLHTELDRAVAYYATLPLPNPDGTSGLGLRVIYRDPIAKAREGEHWADLGNEFHPASHRGVTHWMLVGTGGGGQSGQMADTGSCGVGALYATFIHEFGHQLGLDHTGHWGPHWCPIYSSLMNYAYSYQLGGKGENIGYSAGRLAGVELDERHLSETLPVPLADIEFLSGPPYRYHLQPSADGRSTLVDWNWNGVFGEQDITADINYGYSTTGGQRVKIGMARTATALVGYGTGEAARLVLFAGDLRRESAEATPPAPPAGEPLDLRLYARVWQGSDPNTETGRWSPEQNLVEAGVTGDPSAAYLADAAWVAYPTAEGVRVSRVTLGEGDTLAAGAPVLVPDSKGASPTLVPFAGQLALLLWPGPDKPVSLRTAAPTGETVEFGPVQELPVRSLVPVGAVQGADDGGRPALWLGITENQDEPRPSRWQVRRLTQREDGSFEETQREWVGGESGQSRGQERVVLLWEPSPDFAEGQLHFLQCGMFGGNPPSSCHYIGMRVKDQDVHGGWLVRRYCDEWSTSSSGPGACFFRGNIAYAMRWAAGPEGDPGTGLHLMLDGRGIDNAPMGDFNDVQFIANIGLTRSIPCVEP